MQTVLIQKERQQETSEAVVTATGVARRYGEGDTCV